jgi:hypothetical protein
MLEMGDDFSRDLCRMLANASLAESLGRRLSEQVQEAARARTLAPGVDATLPPARRPAGSTRTR